MEIILFAMVALPMLRVVKALKGKEDAFKAVKGGAFAALLGMFVSFAVLHFMGQGIGSMLDKQIVEASKIAVNNHRVIEMLGITALPKGDRLQAIITVYQSGIVLLPAILSIIASIVAFIEYNLLVLFLTKGESRRRPFARIKDFRLEPMEWRGWLFMYFVPWVLALAGVEELNPVLMNLELLITGIFVVQGMSLFCFITDKKGMIKAIPIIAIIILLSNELGRNILFVAGVIDAIFDLRNRVGKYYG